MTAAQRLRELTMATVRRRLPSEKRNHMQLVELTSAKLNEARMSFYWMFDCTLLFQNSKEVQERTLFSGIGASHRGEVRQRRIISYNRERRKKGDVHFISLLVANPEDRGSGSAVIRPLPPAAADSPPVSLPCMRWRCSGSRTSSGMWIHLAGFAGSFAPRIWPFAE